MPWLIGFEDEPSRVDLRRTHTHLHAAYVRSIAQHFVCTGAMRDTPEGTQTGGMWVLDVPTREEAVALFQGDPFFKEGLRANVRVQHWTTGLWEGRMPG
jgi:uncharacterized protein YciI